MFINVLINYNTKQVKKYLTRHLLTKIHIRTRDILRNLYVRKQKQVEQPIKEKSLNRFIKYHKDQIQESGIIGCNRVCLKI